MDLNRTCHIIKQQALKQIRFSILASIKALGPMLCPGKVHWITPPPKNWKNVSLILFLNHTSLIEFIFCVLLPYRYLKQIAHRLVLPVADTTLKRPFYKTLYSFLSARVIPLSRKRDYTWDYFIKSLEKDDMCIFMPEGRMKRTTGLDKEGKPMTVRGGVYDLLLAYRGREMAVVYSKGLHHVLPPGKSIPKIGQRIEASIEIVSVDQYLNQFDSLPNPKNSLCKDLERRRDLYCND